MKTGLVLSGGGARGIGHLGVIKALQESGFEPSIISGTSAGALVGAFFSAGYTPEEILEIARAIQLFDIRSLHFGKAGVFNMRPIEQVFRKYLKMEMIE
jgi:NTE family protein